MYKMLMLHQTIAIPYSDTYNSDLMNVHKSSVFSLPQAHGGFIINNGEIVFNTIISYIICNNSNMILRHDF